MKKIIIAFLALTGTMSMNAQVMKVMKDGAIVMQYSAATADQVVFDEKPTYEHVDLGLSVEWATFNVGAMNAWEYGDSFAWGETETKASYDKDTYSYTDLIGITSSSILKLENDVAHVKWGGKWRMPTHEELFELFYSDKMEHSEVTMYGGFVKGFLFTSKTKGNSIFLPYAGSKDKTDDYKVGIEGIYWSSTLNTEGNKAIVHWFGDSGEGVPGAVPYLGHSVRPVWDPNM